MLQEWKGGRLQASAAHLPAATPPPPEPTYRVGQHVEVYKNMAPNVHITGGPGQIVQASVKNGTDFYEIKYTHGGGETDLTAVSRWCDDNP